MAERGSQPAERGLDLGRSLRGVTASSHIWPLEC